MAQNVNDVVKTIQKYVGADSDGMWGGQTSARFTEALRVMQAELGLEADGWMGPNTAKKLEEAIANGTVNKEFGQAVLTLYKGEAVDSRGNPVKLNSLDSRRGHNMHTANLVKGDDGHYSIEGGEHKFNISTLMPAPEAAPDPEVTPAPARDNPALSDVGVVAAPIVDGPTPEVKERTTPPPAAEAKPDPAKDSPVLSDVGVVTAPIVDGPKPEVKPAPADGDPDEDAPKATKDDTAPPKVPVADGDYSTYFIYNIVLNNPAYSTHTKKVWDMMRADQLGPEDAIQKYLKEYAANFKAQNGQPLSDNAYSSMQVTLNRQIQTLREVEASIKGIELKPEQIADAFAQDKNLTAGMTPEQIETTRKAITAYESAKVTPDDTLKAMTDSWKSQGIPTDRVDTYSQQLKDRIEFYQSADGGKLDMTTACARAAVDVRATVDRDNGAVPRAIVDENHPYYQSDIARMGDWLRQKSYTRDAIAEAKANGQDLTERQVMEPLYPYIGNRRTVMESAMKTAYRESPNYKPDDVPAIEAKQVGLTSDILTRYGAQLTPMKDALAGMGIDISTPETLAASLRNPEAQQKLVEAIDTNKDALDAFAGAGSAAALKAKITEFNTLEAQRQELLKAAATAPAAEDKPTPAADDKPVPAPDDKPAPSPAFGDQAKDAFTTTMGTYADMSMVPGFMSLNDKADAARTAFESGDANTTLQTTYDLAVASRAVVHDAAIGYVQNNWERLHDYLKKYDPELGDNDYEKGLQILREHKADVINDTYSNRGAFIREGLQSGGVFDKLDKRLTALDTQIPALEKLATDNSVTLNKPTVAAADPLPKAPNERPGRLSDEFAKPAASPLDFGEDFNINNPFRMTVPTAEIKPDLIGQQAGSFGNALSIVSGDGKISLTEAINTFHSLHDEDYTGEKAESDKPKIAALEKELGIKPGEELAANDPRLLQAMAAYANDTTIAKLPEQWKTAFADAASKVELPTAAPAAAPVKPEPAAVVTPPAAPDSSKAIADLQTQKIAMTTDILSKYGAQLTPFKDSLKEMGIDITSAETLAASLDNPESRANLVSTISDAKVSTAIDFMGGAGSTAALLSQINAYSDLETQRQALLKSTPAPADDKTVTVAAAGPVDKPGRLSDEFAKPAVSPLDFGENFNINNPFRMTVPTAEIKPDLIGQQAGSFGNALSIVSGDGKISLAEAINTFHSLHDEDYVGEKAESDKPKIAALEKELGIKPGEELAANDPRLLQAMAAYANNTTIAKLPEQWKTAFADAASKVELPKVPEPAKTTVAANLPDQKALINDVNASLISLYLPEDGSKIPLADPKYGLEMTVRLVDGLTDIEDPNEALKEAHGLLTDGLEHISNLTPRSPELEELNKKLLEEERSVEALAKSRGVELDTPSADSADKVSLNGSPNRNTFNVASFNLDTGGDVKPGEIKPGEEKPAITGGHNFA